MIRFEEIDQIVSRAIMLRRCIEPIVDIFLVEGIPYIPILITLLLLDPLLPYFNSYLRCSKPKTSQIGTAQISSASYKSTHITAIPQWTWSLNGANNRSRHSRTVVWSLNFAHCESGSLMTRSNPLEGLHKLDCLPNTSSSVCTVVPSNFRCRCHRKPCQNLQSKIVAQY